MTSCKNCSALIPSDMIPLFCPECGVTVTDLEQKMAKKGDRGYHQVSMKWQVFFAIMPLITFVAAYRIKKLKTFSIIYSICIVASLIFSGILQILLISLLNRYEIPIYSSGLYSILTIITLMIIPFWIVPSSTMLYLIPKWTREWNQVVAFLEHLEKSQ